MSENWEKNRIYVNREDMRLKMLVDSSILSFKIKKVDARIREFQEKLKAAGSSEDEDILLKEIHAQKKISQKFNTDLSRIITH